MMNRGIVDGCCVVAAIHFAAAALIVGGSLALGYVGHWLGW